MKNYPTWKWIIVLVSVSLAIIFSIPTFLYKEDSGNWFLNNKINLGLDLQGGSYLLLEVESEVLINEELESINDIVTRDRAKAPHQYPQPMPPGSNWYDKGSLNAASPSLEEYNANEAELWRNG